MLRRVGIAFLTGLVILAIAGLSYWAGMTAVIPPQLPAPPATVQTYRVERGTIGRSLSVPVRATWPTSGTARAGAAGIITSVDHAAGSLAAPGTVLATVNLEPLIVAEGSVPMFRTLEEGLEGPDVGQLQELLVAEGYLDGAPTSGFDARTTAAVRNWQARVGATADGTVEPGSLLFIDTLPTRVEVLVSIGEPISEGMDLVRVLAAQPIFVASVSPSLATEATTGMAVSIQAPADGTWEGTLGALEPEAEGGFSAQLSGSLCGDECDVLPFTGELALAATIELVSPTSGVVVPVSAIVQSASGGLEVVLQDGTRQPVEVTAEADGFAAVEGLAEGTVIQLPSPPGS